MQTVIGPGSSRLPRVAWHLPHANSIFRRFSHTFVHQSYPAPVYVYVSHFFTYLSWLRSLYNFALHNDFCVKKFSMFAFLKNCFSQGEFSRSFLFLVFAHFSIFSLSRISSAWDPCFKAKTTTSFLVFAIIFEGKPEMQSRWDSADDWFVSLS